MARYVLEADTTIDGIIFRKGTVMNIPSSNKDVRALGANVDGATGAAATTTPLYTVPRLRFTDTIGAGFVNLALSPPYLAETAVYTSNGFVTKVENQIGIAASTGAFPPNNAGPNTANVIVEPVLPVANSQYD